MHPLIYVNCRDRVTPLRAMVGWLERAGHERIILLDNASTYEPLLAFYAETPHRVVRFTKNLGARSLWKWGFIPSEPFIFTDPDVVPVDECPLDAVQRVMELRARYRVKVGLGLYLEDVPASLPSLEWERGPDINGPLIEGGHARWSLIDTTFAAYPANAPASMAQPSRAIRTGWPYVARHTSWYTTEPDAEDRFYLEHAIAGPQGSSWAEQYRNGGSAG